MTDPYSGKSDTDPQSQYIRASAAQRNYVSQGWEGRGNRENKLDASLELSWAEMRSIDDFINAIHENREGGPGAKLTAGQLSLALKRCWGNKFRFNGMTNLAELQILVEGGEAWVPILDKHIKILSVSLSEKKWQANQNDISDAILRQAYDKPFHPVQDYLLSLEENSDIAPYDLKKVAQDFLGSTNKLHAEYFMRWAVGAVKRVFEPGCKMDYVFVLQGSQGQKKSTFFEALASPKWHTSSMPDNQKDLTMVAHSVWIQEFAELESMTLKRASGMVKNHISIASDMIRIPYGKTQERKERQSVFAATVNPETFLKDPTGNRRYWVIPLPEGFKIDIERLKTLTDSIWKAAMIAYRDGERNWLEDNMEALSNEANKIHVEVDPWIEVFSYWISRSERYGKNNKSMEHLKHEEERRLYDPWFTPPTGECEFFTAREIMKMTCVCKTPTAKDVTRANKCLKELGLITRQRTSRKNGPRSWVWLMPQESPESDLNV